MAIVARFIPLLTVCLMVVMTGCTADADDRIEERQLREHLQAVEPLCDTDYTPGDFVVTEGQAIALAAGKREVDCELVDTEPLNGTWAVHFDAKGPSGCEYNAVIDGKTGEKLEGGGGCP